VTHHDLFERHPDAMGVVDPGYSIRRQNAAARERHGDGVGRPCHEVQFGRSEPCPGCLLGSAVRSGRSESWYMEHRPAGEDVSSYFEVTLIPFLGDDGRVVELVEILRDATMSLGLEHHLIHVSETLDRDVRESTERNEQLARQTETLRNELRELQEEQAALIQTEKLASLGRLAAGLTHEIHTPLGAIIANVDVLERRVERIAAGGSVPEREIAALRDALELHRMAAERIGTIVDSLRKFAHLDRAVIEHVDPHEGIDSAVLLLTHEIRTGIEIVRDYRTLPPLPCRPDAMNQVYMNLLQNAVQAIRSPKGPGSGTIRISTRVEDGPDGTPEAVLEFADDGPGIDPEVVGRLFEPGVTTKPRGVGTGLGLAIAQRTVASHGGRIEVESAPGEGTVFRIRMPLETPRS
jgi:signal transduction histidine kinase